MRCRCPFPSCSHENIYFNSPWEEAQRALRGQLWLPEEADLLIRMIQQGTLCPPTPPASSAS